MYGNFAGRDASRGMAKQSFDTGKFPYEFYSVYRITQFSSLRNVDPDRPTPGQVAGPPPG